MYARDIYVLCTYMCLGGLWYPRRGVLVFGKMFIECDIFHWLCLWVYLGYFLVSCWLLGGIYFCG